MDIVQQTLLDQSKKKKADTFMGGNLSTFEHVVVALENNSMFTHFCFNFETAGEYISL